MALQQALDDAYAFRMVVRLPAGHSFAVSAQLRCVQDGKPHGGGDKGGAMRMYGYQLVGEGVVGYSHLDLIRAPYVLYGVKCTDLVSLTYPSRLLSGGGQCGCTATHCAAGWVGRDQQHAAVLPTPLSRH